MVRPASKRFAPGLDVNSPDWYAELTRTHLHARTLNLAFCCAVSPRSKRHCCQASQAMKAEAAGFEMRAKSRRSGRPALQAARRVLSEPGRPSERTALQPLAGVRVTPGPGEDGRLELSPPTPLLQHPPSRGRLSCHNAKNAVETGVEAAVACDIAPAARRRREDKMQQRDPENAPSVHRKRSQFIVSLSATHSFMLTKTNSTIFAEIHLYISGCVQTCAYTFVTEVGHSALSSSSLGDTDVSRRSGVSDDRTCSTMELQRLFIYVCMRLDQIDCILHKRVCCAHPPRPLDHWGFVCRGCLCACPCSKLSILCKFGGAFRLDWSSPGSV